jgi:DNA-binding Lrp family transcriptional regulator
MNTKRDRPDRIDKEIIKLLLRKPNISQDEIAKKVCLSQPSVYYRIKKLKELGILKFKVVVKL